MKIQNLYQQFQRSLCSDTDSAILRYLEGRTKIDVEQRFHIYHYAYRARLTDVLANDYPKVKALLGEETFKVLAHQYLKRYPSNHPNILYFGQHLAHFLSNTEPYKEQPHLKEIANFEWMMGEASFALDRSLDLPILTANVLSTIPAEKLGDLHITFDASLQLLSFHWNVPQIWQAIEQHITPPTPIGNPNAQEWLIYRLERQVFFRSMASPIETLAFNTMQNQANFAELCEILCEVMAETEVPNFAISCIQQWLNLGIITQLGYHS